MALTIEQVAPAEEDTPVVIDEQRMEKWLSNAVRIANGCSRNVAEGYWVEVKSADGLTLYVRENRGLPAHNRYTAQIHSIVGERQPGFLPPEVLEVNYADIRHKVVTLLWAAKPVIGEPFHFVIVIPGEYAATPISTAPVVSVHYLTPDILR
jgi:hypothetical protein